MTQIEPTTSTASISPRVLIVEDDASTRLLLESLIRRLWAGSQVESFAEVQSALAAWRQHGADLALVDIDLPGIGGLALLEQMARVPGHQTISVIISHHNDRAVVLKAMRYRVRDYIVKPFNARDLMQRLITLMQFSASAPRASTATKSPVYPDLRRLIRDAIGFHRLSLPIDPQRVEQIEAWHLAGQLDRAHLIECCAMESALVARVLGSANSGSYNTDGQAIKHFPQALERLEPAILCNLAIALALQPGSPLQARELHHLADEVRGCQQTLYRRVRDLAAVVKGVDLALCTTACALYRIGELALLQLIQAWVEQGGTLNAGEVVELLKRHGSEADEAIKTQWLIPRPMRELSKATDALPGGASDQNLLILRIAGLQLKREDSDDIRQLKKRAGLSIEPNTTVAT